MDDFPGFRFTTWNSLPPHYRDLAVQAGYEEMSWNSVGTYALEKMAWSDMTNATQRDALRDMGFDANTWDCYMNHYWSYSWIDLVVEGLHAEAQVLGFTAQLWDNGSQVATDSSDWVGLSDGEKRAARALCYFEGTWDGGYTLHDMPGQPILYPYFRFQPWSYLTPQEKALATIVGWEDSTWDTPVSADVTDSAFDDLPEEARQAAMELGFYQEQYDCWINHYFGYSWEELVDYDMATYFETLGFTQDLFETQGRPESYDLDWRDLSDDQKAAADELCFTEDIWNQIQVILWYDEQPVPHFRYKPWSHLRYSQQLLAAKANYTRESWNVPGTNPVERLVFKDLTREQQDALQALGFYSADLYNCVSVVRTINSIRMLWALLTSPSHPHILSHIIRYSM